MKYLQLVKIFVVKCANEVSMVTKTGILLGQRLFDSL